MRPAILILLFALVLCIPVDVQAQCGPAGCSGRVARVGTVFGVQRRQNRRAARGGLFGGRLRGCG